MKQEYQIQWETLPKTLEEMQQMPEAALQEPAHTVALTIAALCVYPEDHEECYRILDYLRGSRPLSPMERQFIRDRFMDGRDYIPRSYLAGATPENNYTPDAPYTIRVNESFAQFAEEGYIRMECTSGGADTKRPVTLRLKPSTGQWFLWEQSLLVGIRIPKEQDEWA